VDAIRERLGVFERRACRVLVQARSTQRRRRAVASDEPPLVDRVVEAACEDGRYGYRRVTDLLHEEGWRVNHKRVERIWRQEGLKVPKRQPKRGRLWLNDGSCIRLRPLHKDHVWSYDFVADRPDDGRPLRMLTIMDEYTRECLAIDVERHLTSEDVLERLADLFVVRGTPDFIRADNGPEFTAEVMRDWLARLGVKTLFIEPGSPWENGFIESFNGKFRDELLNGEILTTLEEAKVLMEGWRHHSNTNRPHSSLGRRPPAPETILPRPPGFAPLRQAAVTGGLTQDLVPPQGRVTTSGLCVCDAVEDMSIADAARSVMTRRVVQGGLMKGNGGSGERLPERKPASWQLAVPRRSRRGPRGGRRSDRWPSGTPRTPRCRGRRCRSDSGRRS